MKILLIFISLLWSTVSIALDINGPYKGTSSIEGKNIHVVLENINHEKLSYQIDMFATTGGKRVFLYFNIDDKDGAELCGYIYRNTMILKRESDPGFHNITVDIIPIIRHEGKSVIVIPAEYFKTEPLKIWTFQQ